MSTRHALATYTGVVAVASILVAISAALWWPAGEGHAAGVVAALGLVPPVAAIAAYLALLGLAVIVWMPGLSNCSGLGVAIGVGAALIAVLIPATYAILGSATVLIWPVALASLISLVATIVVRVRRDGLAVVARAVRNRAAGLLVRSGDLAAAAIAAGVLFTVARFGTAGWTTLINDFHRYAGSAMVWISDSGAGQPFAEQFPGVFGREMMTRASHEKPGATGLLVAAAQVSGLQPYQLLTPLSVVLLGVVIAATVATLRGMFGLRLSTALVCALPPSLSLVPLSRLFDAQLGHVAAVALLSTGLAVTAMMERSTSIRGRIGQCSAAGVLFAGAILTNATVVLSFAPVVLVLVVWALTRKGWTVRELPRFLGGMAAVILVCLAPFGSGIIKSLSQQTTGVSGVSTPFPSPLALFGLQPGLDAFDSIQLAWITWGFALLIVALGLIISRARRVDKRGALAVLVVSTMIVVGLGVSFGFDNYAVHKWLATWIPVAAPILLAAIAANLPERGLNGAKAVLAASSVGAFLIASQFGYRVDHVVPPQLFALSSDESITDLDDLNVDLGDLYLNSLGSLAMTAGAVHVVDATYAAADDPVGNTYLIDAGAPLVREWQDVTALDPRFALARLDLRLSAGTTSFAGGDGTARSHLFGAWREADSSAAWSGQGQSLIVFDVGEDLDGADVHVRIQGINGGAPNVSGELSVSIFDRTTTYTSSGDSRITIDLTVDQKDVVAHDGRIVVRLRHGVQADAGGADRGFGLQTLTLAREEDD